MATPSTHLLLIAIDAYPDQRDQLRGCANDIVAIHDALLPHLDARRTTTRVLASPHQDTDFPLTIDAPATATNIRTALAELERIVEAGDRVILHYSGHGLRRMYRSKGHDQAHYASERLLPVDFRTDRRHEISDRELNTALARISARCPNVTLILDCCHSAGAARDPGAADPESRPRYVEADELVEMGAPDEVIEPDFAPERAVGDGELALAAATASAETKAAPLVLAACMAQELAREGRGPGGQVMGKLTEALTTVLGALSKADFQRRIWRELWPKILTRVTGQHPRVYGPSERRLFSVHTGAGAGDLLVEAQPAAATQADTVQRFDVHSGRRFGITTGTRIAVYDPESQTRVGVLIVERSEDHRAQAVRDPAGPVFPFPEFSRCSVLRYAAPQLEVRILGELDAEIRAKLEEDGNIELVDPRTPLAEAGAGELRLVADRDTWVLWDDDHGPPTRDMPELFRCQTADIPALLAHALRHQAPIRLAQQCSERAGLLTMRMLDATEVTTPQDHDGPELPIEPERGHYRVAHHHPFVVEVRNHTLRELEVTVLVSESSGTVLHLDAAVLPAGSKHLFWLNGELGAPLWLDGPSGLERFVAIGTERREADLSQLATAESFAEAISAGRAGKRNVGGARKRACKQSPLWVAAVATIHGG
ncbi:putative peptidase [Plesiocystis pacifica SIR-1]|uniref:Putative peptidase n=1 Tax=Plesiocystis pacifica SIR-1 TaxID=391625 RepID=A6G3B8_9BACT|nr:putative peptidase [Plesiocystis pacifica SIR-1]